MRFQTLSMSFLIAFCFAGAASAQRGGQAPASARDSAPVDLTGYWVSVVSEDWRHRMATPRRGDYESLPLNQAGRAAADAWDLDADNAAGLECRAFGIGGIMRQPGRLNIAWEDEDTLSIDFDAGRQTRLLHFDPTARPSGEPTWQGHSIAEWERPPGGGGRGNVRAQIGNIEGPVAPGGGGRGQRGGPPLAESLFQGGSLKVTTTNFRAGYLRKNGVPYGEDATITEYLHRLPEHPNGDVWLLVTTIVEDPVYLSQPFYTSTHFRLEPDDDGWDPRPCRTAPPPP
ncbi:MAG TPA: hypothetical protein VMR74_07390 [Gammaproteobacteria bacterium]|nr:hypothetical protein [Gammaproteobacteria bacterium]